MKDLHIKLGEQEQFELGQLSLYTKRTYSDIIRTLIQIAFESAYTQAKVVKSEEDLEDLDNSYHIMHITDIFDHLYPPKEEL